MKHILYLFLLLSSSSFAQHRPKPSEWIDIKKYTFRVELNDSTNVISGIAELAFVCKKSMTGFDLDLISKGNGGMGMQVSRILHKDSPLKYIHENDRIKITLNASQGEQGTLTINYSGIPQDGLIISRNKYGDRTFFADNWPDRGHNWLPVIDHPADKAAVDFIVVAPLHYEVVSNGIRMEESYLNPKQKLTRYSEDTEISTKVMVIGVARFAIQQAGVVNHIPVESWVYPQNRAEGFYDYALAVKVLDFFNSHIGPYSYKKLANVQSKTTFGGLENASAIFYFENSVTGKADHEGLIAHEIAHQWFGNSATEREWPHVWLSEGFATYFAILFAEFAHGEDKRQEEMIKDRDQVLSFYKKEQIPVVNPNITTLMKILNANTYQKGSWVLHMLRREIGDQQFWTGIKAYYKKFQNSTALTSDLQEVMEVASGKDLDTFFNQWIYTAGHPVIDGSWKYDEASKTLKISVQQTQKMQGFSFPLEIAISFEGKDFQQVEKVYINKESTSISIPVTAKPSKLTLDPNVNLLFEGNLRN
jgi:aminopeptidase N